MRQIVFDIETSAVPFNSLAESQQEYILRAADKEKVAELRTEKEDEAIRMLSLYPFTAKVVVIGIFDVQNEKSYIYYESEEHEEWESENRLAKFKGVSEHELIESFWRITDAVDQVISFNGRNFDLPFLMLRSAMLKIKPSKNFMGYRFDITQHIDLLEQFSFFGAFKKFNLDFYCHSFGVASPKAKGVSGMDVKNLYDAGRIKDIALYCADDIAATYKLFKIWEEFLQFKK